MRLASINPATGAELGSVETASKAGVDAAFESTRTAQLAWHATPWKEKRQILRRFRADLVARRDEAAHLITAEAGKPLAESMMADVLPTLEFAKHLERITPGALQAKRIRLHNPLLWGRRSTVTREPVGTVGVIAPWNYPLAIPATGILTALMAGNCLLFKPAEQTPLTGAWLVERLHAAGVPQEALHVLQGKGDVGASVVADADAIIFTGSVPTGRKVAASCADRMVPACVELGGKDPMLMLPGRRREGTHGAAVWGAFTNAGQTCAAVERLYVHAPELEATTQDIIGRAQALRVGPGTEAVDMGPVIDDESAKRIMHHIQDAEKRGAEILCGGDILEEGPRFLAPTVLGNVDHDMLCMREETFGPTLPIMGYGRVEDAVMLCNDTEYGLTASVWGDGAEEVAPRLHAGTVMVNECLYTYAAPETPWSGWKASGHGASHGPDPFGPVTQIRHIHVAKGKVDSWHYPYDDQLDEFLDGGIRYLHQGNVPAGLKALRKK